MNADADRQVVAAVAALRAITRSRPRTKSDALEQLGQVRVIVEMLDQVPEMPTIGAYRRVS